MRVFPQPESLRQEFLEVLSHGCPVLGTRNTCLTDLGRDTEGIFLAKVGNFSHLQHQLEYLAEWLPNNIEIRVRAHERAAQFAWEIFRLSLCQGFCSA